MIEREAVEKLKAYSKCQLLQVKGIYEDCNEKKCDNCDLCYMQGTTGEHREAIDMAIQALEKQIPKKPVKKSFIVPYEGINVCPSCKEPLGGKRHYCSKCGQKLDWSDED